MERRDEFQEITNGKQKLDSSLKGTTYVKKNKIRDSGRWGRDDGSKLGYSGRPVPSQIEQLMIRNHES